MLQPRYWSGSPGEHTQAAWTHYRDSPTSSSSASWRGTAWLAAVEPVERGTKCIVYFTYHDCITHSLETVEININKAVYRVIVDNKLASGLRLASWLFGYHVTPCIIDIWRLSSFVFTNLVQVAVPLTSSEAMSEAIKVVWAMTWYCDIGIKYWLYFPFWGSNHWLGGW